MGAGANSGAVAGVPVATTSISIPRQMWQGQKDHVTNARLTMKGTGTTTCMQDQLPSGGQSWGWRTSCTIEYLLWRRLRPKDPATSCQHSEFDVFSADPRSCSKGFPDEKFKTYRIERPSTPLRCRRRKCEPAEIRIQLPRR